MKQYTKNMLESETWIMLLWGVTILCLVFAGSYAFRYKAFLSSQVQFDPNSLSQIDPNEAELKAYVAEDQNVMEAMKVDNLLVKAPPKTNPVTEVDIIGQEALINGKLYKVGDKVGDAKIIAITAQSVTVEWNGASEVFSPINGQGQGGGPSGPSRGPGPGARKRPGPRVARSMSGPPPGMTRPSPEEMERLKNMSPEERNAFIQAKMNSRR
ncbi:MAG: hypothetical protein HQ515_04410 [Phycisphaeraceae bacterium]|nr:hypothetical protein [Phycisphaeraceae bacterium]